MMNSCDRRFMALALEQAEEAARAGEVPVGAVAVVGGKAVVSARNRVEERRSATAHAELELLHKLELLRGDWRMEDVTVYVTKEPCPMCAGALVNARVRRIVYGAADPRFGGCSVFGIPAHPGSLWKPEVTPEICAAYRNHREILPPGRSRYCYAVAPAACAGLPTPAVLPTDPSLFSSGTAGFLLSPPTVSFQTEAENP